MVRRQTVLPVKFKNHLVEAGYRIDMTVADCIIVEIKAIEKVARIHEAQLYTYLRLSGIRVGLLINFNVAVLRDGILRRVI